MSEQASASGKAHEPLVELVDVHLAFGDQEVLQGVNLRVWKGERLVVLGRSGGGKSTLLRVILGILRPTQGVVRFEGVEIDKLRRRDLNWIRQKIGMVYQYSALISSLTVRGNLALPLEELTWMGPADIEDVIADKLALVGMEKARDKMPNELSGGMKKRIAMARALVLDPELILYDEPSAGLDPVTAARVDELMISLSEELRCASIIVTHELGSAFKVATRMAMLHDGRIIADCSPEEFRHLDNPVVSQFIAGGGWGAHDSG